MSVFSKREKLFKEKTGKEFIDMYDKYFQKLIYFTNNICKDRQKAEDLSTDAFIKALDKIEKYNKEKAQFSTWLFTIAKNLAFQDLKKSKKSISMDVEYDSDGTTMKDFITKRESDPEISHGVSIKKASIMKKRMSELKEPYKTVIEMREVKKMAYKDIAHELNKNLSTIKSQIRNGRHILVDQTKKEFDEIDELYK